jgi:hypothetical protein
MNLSDLKNILYQNKNKNKLSDKIVNILKQKINNIILKSKEISDETDKTNETNETDETNETNETDETNETESIETESNYLDDVKKLYSRNDKKVENEKFTQSSRKLYDRMMSHAEIINNSYKNITKKQIEKPFINSYDNITKLGDRKNIKKKY